MTVAVQRRLAVNRAVFDWTLRQVGRCVAKGQLESALQWGLIAARTAVAFECGQLASHELETYLRKVAEELPSSSTGEGSPSVRQHRWLHVLTTATAVGGHISLVRRWIQLDAGRNRHTIVLLSQEKSVPEALICAVKDTGGDVLGLEPDTPLVQQALWLREIAFKLADRVVLYTHPWDVVPMAAFARRGGPPVLLVNHTDHLFWVGASVADLVLNLRDSAQDWSARYRGVNRNMCLPIPLALEAGTDETPHPERSPREAARRALGLPPRALVLLTIGMGYKYRPLPGLDFLQAAQAIINSRPDAHLLAVGPVEDARWRAAKVACGGRLRAEGIQEKLTPYYAAADLYIEGFPIGSLTAFLDAGLRGIPCVRAPALCPPLLSSDGVALQELARPTDSADYVSRVLAMLEDDQGRERCGRRLAVLIRSHHSGAGWLRYLRAVQDRVPMVHEIYPLSAVPLLPLDVQLQREQLLFRVWGDPVLTAVRLAGSLGLRARPDALLCQLVPVHLSKLVAAWSLRRFRERISKFRRFPGPSRTTTRDTRPC